jgi:hypothetical protein
LVARCYDPVNRLDKARGRRRLADADMTIVYELTLHQPFRRRDEPPITVRADRAGVIIQPHPGQLDGDATAALVAAINAAVASGAAALIDLEREPLDQLPRDEHRCSRGRGKAEVAQMTGPGMVELAAGAQPWLLDVVGRRLSRVHAADHRFLPASAWLGVRAVTVSAASVGATTDAGDRVVEYRST